MSGAWGIIIASQGKREIERDQPDNQCTTGDDISWWLTTNAIPVHPRKSATTCKLSRGSNHRHVAPNYLPS